MISHLKGVRWVEKSKDAPALCRCADLCSLAGVSVHKMLCGPGSGTADLTWSQSLLAGVTLTQHPSPTGPAWGQLARTSQSCEQRLARGPSFPTFEGRVTGLPPHSPCHFFCPATWHSRSRDAFPGRKGQVHLRQV